MKLSNDISLPTPPKKNEIIADIKNENSSTPFIKNDKFKLLENIPKIHAFEIPKENKKEKDSPLRSKKETFSKFKCNPYFVNFFFYFYFYKKLFF